MMSEMINYCTCSGVLLLVAILLRSGSCESVGSDGERKDVADGMASDGRRLQAGSEIGQGRHGGAQLYNRWEKDETNSISDNDIGISSDITSSSSDNNNPTKQEYACGRAMASKKYRDILTGVDQVSNQISVTRNKYRPTEIRMPRIIGGDETAPGEFPWTVSMKLNGQPICGGSLIDRDWILTAAHCVVGYNPKNITIRLGAYRIKDSSEKQTVDIPVSMFIVHKDYSMPRPFSNDIALLKLNEPIEFSDFIIPICLPKNDHLNHIIASSSATIEQANDYMKKYQMASAAAAGGGGGSSGNEDSGGIVVSTKMSDNDIAKCFNRLEQNYLNSIGLGHVNEANSGETTTTTTTTTRAPVPSTTPTTVSASNTPMPPTNMLFTYGNLINLMGSSNNHNHKQPINNNKITFLNHQKPLEGGHHFESPYVMNASPNLNLGSTTNYNEPHTNHIYYGLSWNNRKTDEAARKEMVKLSKLPINKELLREIQSVGSGSMQTLGLQQGDFMAMANDLAAGNGANSGVSDRERIITTNNRNHLRVSTEEETDDPSKYSGMNGIVVGWGWVREQDGEDQLNKAYPSVTLQKVKLPILRNNVCEAWFQSQAKKITLLPSQFCAGFNSGGKDACRGDSGGPMIIEDDSETGRYQLIGIVSAGIGCARPSLPGLYTRVASFLPWIRAQLARY